MKDRTTIQLPKALIEELKELKKYKRETYEEIIRKMMKQNRAKAQLKKKMRKL